MPIFRRYSQSSEQVIPVSSDTDIYRIFDFLNIKESQKFLVLVYIISLFVGEIAHPIAVVYGSR